MINTATITRRPHAHKALEAQRSHCHLSLVILTCLVTSAGAEDGRPGNSSFPYQPYNESEIESALREPLTLDDCIRIALKKNIALRVAEGDLSRAEVSHAGSYGAFLPVFTLEGTRINELAKSDTARSTSINSAARLVDSNFGNQAMIVGSVQLYTPTGATLQFSNDFVHDVQVPLYQRNPASPEATSRADNRSYSLSITQPLLRGAGPTVARGDLLSTGYDREAQESQLLSTKLQTVVAVKRAYYDALSRREIVKVNATAVHNDSALVESSEALTVAKLATRRDVLSAQIRFAEDRASFITSQNDFELALDVLKDFMGLAIETPIQLDETGLSFVPVTLDEPALILSALEYNPSIQSAKIGIKRSRLQRTLARNTLLPQLDLVALYSSNREKDLVLNRDMSHTGGFTATVNLSYAFLNREASANAENADIAMNQQEDRLLDLERQIVLNVRDIVRSVYSSAEEINAIKRSIEVAEDKLAFANTMFSLGRASNFDITDAQEFLLNALNQYLSQLVEYHTQLALLESLTGKPVTP